MDSLFDILNKNQSDNSKLVIGLFFCPVEGVPDECTNYLIQLYKIMNGGNDGLSNPNVNEKNNQIQQQRKTLLEVIHIFLTNSIHWLDRCTIDETKIYEHLNNFPWYSIPVGDKERVVSLKPEKFLLPLPPPTFFPNEISLINTPNFQLGKQIL